jgi:RNA polymerase sigma-70 factor (ECF subfamily)
MQSSERTWRERGLRDAVLSGDAAAWRAWYDESFDGLYAYVNWRCAGLRDLSDDVVQDVWLIAVRRIRRFDPQRGPFAAWLRGIAANVLRNHLRRQSRQVRPLAERCHNGSAGAEWERREQSERIAQALATLPEHYEAVLRAKYLDGQSVADIASASQESVKAVESLLTRARQAFREAYQNEE